MKDFTILEASDVTSTKALTEMYNTTRYDYVARISKDTTSDLPTVKLAPTAFVVDAFKRAYHDVQQSVSSLQHLVKWQHKIIDYNSSYIALLLEQIDEEEFEEVAASFAENTETYNCESLAIEIDRINSLTGIPYSAMDYSNIFAASEEEVDRAMSMLENSKNIMRARQDWEMLE